MLIEVRSQKSLIKGELLEKEIKPFGKGGHIILSKKHIGKKVKIIIPSEESIYEEEFED
jgi:putative transposon-encoded protein